MLQRGLLFWPIRLSRKAILLSLLVTFSITLLYIRFAMPLDIMVAGILLILIFYLTLHYASKSWMQLPQRSFEMRLFWVGSFLRLLIVGYLYLLTAIHDPDSWPFEIGAMDSNTYDYVAKMLMKQPLSNYDNYLDFMKGRADYGYPIYQSILYKIFGPNTFWVRLLNVILSSITVIQVSRIARYLYSDRHAKYTGIIMMVIPSLMFYCGLQLKETLMIFLLTTAFYNAVKIKELKRLSLIGVTMLILSAVLLFYFRTFMAVIAIVSILSYLALAFFSSSRAAVLLFVFFIGAYFLLSSAGIEDDIVAQYTDSQNDFLQRGLDSKANMANVSYNKAIVIPFMMAGAAITPFPSFLNTEERQVGIITVFQNEIIRNFMYYFYFMGVLYALRRYFKKSIMLLIFVGGYILAITIGGSSFQERFQLPALPFIIIFMSLGIAEATPKSIKWWNVYLVGVILAEVAWTTFKLTIRNI